MPPVRRCRRPLVSVCNVNHNGPPLDSTEMRPACLPLPRQLRRQRNGSRCRHMTSFWPYKQLLSAMQVRRRVFLTGNKRPTEGGALLPWACLALSFFSGGPLSTVTPPTLGQPGLCSAGAGRLGGPKLPSFLEDSSVSVHMVFPAGPPIRSVVQCTSVQSTYNPAAYSIWLQKSTVRVT